MKIIWEVGDIRPGRQVQKPDCGVTGLWMVGYRVATGRDQPVGGGSHVANIYGLVSLADGLFVCFGDGTKDDVVQHLNEAGYYVPVELKKGNHQ